MEKSEKTTYAMNQARIGVVGYCPPTKYNEQIAAEYLNAAFNRVLSDFSNKSIVIVSGGTNVGVLAQAYELASKMGFETCGIACEKAANYELYPTTEKQIIVGKNWGDESPVFIYGTSRILSVDSIKHEEYLNHPHYGLDALIRIGNGPQSMRETEMIKEQGKPTYEYDLPRLE